MMRPKPILWLSILLFIAAGLQLAGCNGGSEVIADNGGSEVIGQLVREDHIPIAALEVRALKITLHDSAGIPVADTIVVQTTQTNDTGYFLFDSLPQDTYTLSAPYQSDSLILPYTTFSPDPESRVTLPAIVMKVPGAISGIIDRTVVPSQVPVFCSITGTVLTAIADPVSGKFTINPLPPDTTYTVTIFANGFLTRQITGIQVTSAEISDLPSAIILEVDPAGLPPAPQNLVVTYQPHLGTAMLTWNRVMVPDVNRYVVYTRGTVFTRQDTVSDTTCIDTIFNDRSDTLEQKIYLQVAALDDDNNAGPRGPVDTLDAIPPSWFEVAMDIQPGTIPDGFDSIPVILQFSSKRRTVSSAKWWADHPDSVIRQQKFDNVTNGTDTLYWRTSFNKKRIYVKVSDTTGWDHTDSIDASSLKPINVWRNIDSLTTERRDAGACMVDGKLYVFGGASKKPSVTGEWSLRPLATAEMYDPATGKWSEIASMKIARQKAACAVVNGRIYVIGGLSRNSVTRTIESYDPSTDAWTMEPDSLQVGLIGAAACTLNGKIIITGGMSGNSDSIVIHNAVFSYDPEAHELKLVDSMKTARHMHRAVAVGGSILLIGGLGIDDSDIFGAKPLSSMECLFGNGCVLCTSPISLPNGYYGIGAAVVNNTLIVLGGLRGISDKEQSLNSVDIVSTENGSSSSGSDMPIGCEGMAVTAGNGGIYMIGGNTGDVSSQEISRAVYVYYP